MRHVLYVGSIYYINTLINCCSCVTSWNCNAVIGDKLICLVYNSIICAKTHTYSHLHISRHYLHVNQDTSLL
jgi:hypothetical protein